MFRRLLAFFDNRALKSDRDKQRSIDWVTIVSRISGHVGRHSIYLETRGSGFVSCDPHAIPDGEEIVAVVVAYVVDGVESWDTEEPTRQIADTLSQLLGRKLPILLSRDYRSFVGYYVRIDA